MATKPRNLCRICEEPVLPGEPFTTLMVEPLPDAKPIYVPIHFSCTIELIAVRVTEARDEEELDFQVRGVRKKATMREKLHAVFDDIINDMVD